MSDQNNFGRYLPTETANTHIRTALLSTPSTQDAQVAGVGTTKTGYVIRFKDPESAEAARNNSEWLNELGNNTKLVKPRFGVVVHRTPTDDFDLENANAQAIEKIMEENELTGEDSRSKRSRGLRRRIRRWGSSHPSASGSTPRKGPIYTRKWLYRWPEIHRQCGTLRTKRKRCFRCQRFGHFAWSCKETPRCGHCAGQHERERCPPGVRARCLDCGGDHPTSDRQCLTPATFSSQC
ncbi:unnamed protein product [Penicillium salamii]|nr:unnamed protein product [Penicillium salamii]